MGINVSALPEQVRYINHNKEAEQKRAFYFCFLTLYRPPNT